MILRCILIAHFTGDGGNEYFGREPYPHTAYGRLPAQGATPESGVR